MVALSSATVTRIAGDIHRLLHPDDYRLERPTLTEDGTGGHTTTWATHETSKGRLDTTGLSPDVRAVAERIGASTRYSIKLPRETIAQSKDRIAIAGRQFPIIDVLRGGQWTFEPVALVDEHD